MWVSKKFKAYLETKYNMQVQSKEMIHQLIFKELFKVHLLT